MPKPNPPSADRSSKPIGAADKRDQWVQDVLEDDEVRVVLDITRARATSSQFPSSGRGPSMNPTERRRAHSARLNASRTLPYARLRGCSLRDLQ
jgi:hypothetical protein